MNVVMFGACHPHCAFFGLETNMELGTLFMEGQAQCTAPMQPDDDPPGAHPGAYPVAHGTHSLIDSFNKK